MEVTEAGVALPALGVSVFGVDVTRRLLVTFRARGDWITGAVVLVGSGGNAAGATTDFEAESAVADTLAFAGTEMFKPDACRLSAPFTADCADGTMPVVTDCFLAVIGKAAGLTELIDLVTAGVVGVFPLLDSRAGNSSDCRTGCEACEAIVFESPLLKANCCTSCFACNIGVSDLELGAARDGGAGTETLESGVAARG
jgi:hypothetical protein